MENFKCVVCPHWDSLDVYKTNELGIDVIAFVAVHDCYDTYQKVSTCLSKEDAIRLHKHLGELLDEI